MLEMTEAQWRAFVQEGTRTGKLATVRADGLPHVMPIWFVLDARRSRVHDRGADRQGAQPAPWRSREPVRRRRPAAVRVRHGQRRRSRSKTTPTRCSRSRPGSRRATWAPTGPRSSAGATPSRASCSCACTPSGSSRNPASRTTRLGMTNPRAFRFGVEMMEPFEGMTWAESARELESLGYSTLFAPDHFDEGFGPITAMATAAAATTTLNVATAVFAADFRHPAGARPRARVDRRALGGTARGRPRRRLPGRRLPGSGIVDGPAEGPRRSADRARRRPPRTVRATARSTSPASTTGSTRSTDRPRRTARAGHRSSSPVAARGCSASPPAHADIVGVNPSLPSSAERARGGPPDALPERIDEKFSWIREAAGARFDELEFHGWLRFAHVTDDAQAIAAAADARRSAPGADERARLAVRPRRHRRRDRRAPARAPRALGLHATTRSSSPSRTSSPRWSPDSPGRRAGPAPDRRRARRGGPPHGHNRGRAVEPGQLLQRVGPVGGGHRRVGARRRRHRLRAGAGGARRTRRAGAGVSRAAPCIRPSSRRPSASSRGSASS